MGNEPRPPDPPPLQHRPATYVATHPDRPAVITSAGAVVTFAELEARSCRLAQALHAHGLRPGDHVAVLLPNDHRTHEVSFGLQRSGLYYTMVNTHLAADEAAYIVNDCGARTLITSAALSEPGRRPGPPHPRHRPAAHGGRHDLADGHTSYDEFVDGFPTRAPARRGGGLPHALLLGHHRPSQRGAPAAHRRRPSASSATLAPMLGRIMGFGPGDVYLSPAPLYHAAPLGFVASRCRAFGGTVVMMERFDARTGAWDLIERYKVTHSQSVPHHVRAHAEAA